MKQKNILFEVSQIIEENPSSPKCREMLASRTVEFFLLILLEIALVELIDDNIGIPTEYINKKLNEVL